MGDSLTLPPKRRHIAMSAVGILQDDDLQRFGMLNEAVKREEE
jgi:hypothetical protein